MAAYGKQIGIGPTRDNDLPVALVTGANRGLGREIARQLGCRGMHVIVASRDLAKGRHTAEDLCANDPVLAEALPLDVTDEQSVAAAAIAIDDRHGHLDALVNNAGRIVARPGLETTADELRETFETNVFGVATVIRCMLPLLHAAAAPRIVNVTSTTGSLARFAADADSFGGDVDERLAYSTSKSALNMLTLQYAEAFRRSGDLRHLRINAVTPGFVATEMNGYQGTRSVEDGARVIVDLAMLAEDCPSGRFFEDDGEVPW